jgi:hypothetical protein
MCSIVIFPDASGGYRIGMNRDERRTRAPATETREVGVSGGRSARYPIDPEGRGTWIAARSDGLTLALLNQYGTEVSSASAPLLSRGVLIPKLLESDDVGDVMIRLTTILRRSPKRIPSFLLVAIERNQESISSLRWDEAGRIVDSRVWPREPRIFTSSSWNAEDTIAFREASFQRFLDASASSPSQAEILKYLHTSEQGEEKMSVAMSRAESRTVSTTWIESTSLATRMEYFPNALE